MPRRRDNKSGPNPKSTPKEVGGSHGHRPHGKSILWPALYEHLRAKGYSKEKSARISNAAWNKKHGDHTPKSARAIAKSYHEGAMVALTVTGSTAAALVRGCEGALEEDDLHITLQYLGKGADFSPEARQAILKAVEDVALRYHPLEGMTGQMGHFPAGDDGTPWWVAPAVPRLREFRQEVHDALAGKYPSSVDRFPTWKPHITLAYTQDGQPPPTSPSPLLPLDFREVLVTFAGERYTIPLGHKVAKAEPRDGDKDGFVYDGTKRMRPVRPKVDLDLNVDEPVIDTEPVVTPMTEGMEARLGRCYELSAQEVAYSFDGSKLVHGSIEGMGQPRLAHAWVERPNGDVWEPISRETYDTTAWGAIFNPETYLTYDAEETRINMVRSEHYGPWDEAASPPHVRSEVNPTITLPAHLELPMVRLKVVEDTSEWEDVDWAQRVYDTAWTEDDPDPVPGIEDEDYWVYDDPAEAMKDSTEWMDYTVVQLTNEQGHHAKTVVTRLSPEARDKLFNEQGPLFRQHKQELAGGVAPVMFPDEAEKRLKAKFPNLVKLKVYGWPHTGEGIDVNLERLHEVVSEMERLADEWPASAESIAAIRLNVPVNYYRHVKVGHAAAWVTVAPAHQGPEYGRSQFDVSSILMAKAGVKPQNWLGNKVQSKAGGWPAYESATSQEATVATVVRHEWGHVLHHMEARSRARQDPDGPLLDYQWAPFKLFLNERIPGHNQLETQQVRKLLLDSKLSGYGDTNAPEAFAELYTLYTASPKTRASMSDELQEAVKKALQSITEAQLVPLDPITKGYAVTNEDGYEEFILSEPPGSLVPLEQMAMLDMDALTADPSDDDDAKGVTEEVTKSVWVKVKPHYRKGVFVPGYRRKLSINEVKDRSRKIKGNKPTSAALHKRKGKYTPERMELHQTIIDMFLGDVEPSTDPTVSFLGGGPGVGKSTLVNNGMADLPVVEGSDATAVLANSDDIKELFPEYEGLKALGDRTAASFVHQESMDVMAELLRQAFDKQVDVLFDGTGDNGLHSVEARVREMRGYGYKVNAVYATTDEDTAWDRVQERGKETGRWVPPDIFDFAHYDVSRTFRAALKARTFDTAKLYDTTTSLPVLIASSDGKTNVMHDTIRWGAFLHKGGLVQKADEEGSPKLGMVIDATLAALNGTKPPAGTMAWYRSASALRVPSGMVVDIPGDFPDLTVEARMGIRKRLLGARR